MKMGKGWGVLSEDREGLGGLTEAIDGVLTEDGEGEGLGRRRAGGPPRGHSWCPHRGSRRAGGGLTEAIDGVSSRRRRRRGWEEKGWGVLQEAIVVSLTEDREGLGGLTEANDGVLTEDGEGEGLGGEGLGVLTEDGEGLVVFRSTKLALVKPTVTHQTVI